MSKHKSNKKKHSEYDSKKILEIKTTHTAALKQVVERISNVISDCPITFVRPDDSLVDDEIVDEYYEEVDENPVKKNKKKKNKKDDSDDEEENDEDSDDGKSKKKKSTKKSKKKIIEQPPSKKDRKKKSDKNTGGIRILTLTEDKSILIKLVLDACNFEYFKCGEQKITVGVDMHNLHAMLRMVNDDHPIIIYMNRDNRSALYIRSLNEGNERSEETDLEIYLMDIPNPEIPLPPTAFENFITMAADKFHTICKHLNNNSSTVEITSVGNEIKFKGENDGGKAIMSYRDTNHNPKKGVSDKIVQGTYELRNLMCFSKCNKLCNVIVLYMKNDFPLVLVISVATLGKMYVFLTPVENPNK